MHGYQSISFVSNVLRQCVCYLLFNSTWHYHVFVLNIHMGGGVSYTAQTLHMPSSQEASWFNFWSSVGLFQNLHTKCLKKVEGWGCGSELYVQSSAWTFSNGDNPGPRYYRQDFFLKVEIDVVVLDCQTLGIIFLMSPNLIKYVIELILASVYGHFLISIIASHHSSLVFVWVPMFRLCD